MGEGTLSQAWQSRSEPSTFVTGTTGAENYVGSMMISCCSLSMAKSRLFFSHSAFGTGRALQYFGVSPTSRCGVAVMILAFPSSFRKTASCLARTSSSGMYLAVYCTAKADQFNFRTASKLLPNQLEFVPPTTKAWGVGTVCVS